MDVTYFRPTRLGPEAALEKAVADCIPDIFPDKAALSWTAGSLPVGAGMPDLLAVACKPHLSVLPVTGTITSHVLGYLRAVRHARIETISNNVRFSHKDVRQLLDILSEIGAVVQKSDAYSLSENWREIIPEVMAIEVKVEKWKDAIKQAKRNRLFSHRSFVALPERIAKRILGNDVLKKLGIGLLAVTDNMTVRILKKARRSKPRIWSYYYQIALVAALHV